MTGVTQGSDMVQWKTSLRIGINLDCVFSHLSRVCFRQRKHFIRVFPFLFSCTVFLHLVFHFLYARHLKNFYEISTGPKCTYPKWFFFNSAFWKSGFAYCSETTSAVLYFKISFPSDALVNFYQNLWLYVGWPKEGRGIHGKSQDLLAVWRLVGWGWY